MSERPKIVIKKGDILKYDEKGITIEYKGEEWTIQYGRYIKKEDIDNANEGDEIVIEKYGKWIVSRVNKKKEKVNQEKKIDDYKEMSEDSITSIDALKVIADIIKDMYKRINEIEKRVSNLERERNGNQ